VSVYKGRGRSTERQRACEDAIGGGVVEVVERRSAIGRVLQKQRIDKGSCVLMIFVLGYDLDVIAPVLWCMDVEESVLSVSLRQSGFDTSKTHSPRVASPCLKSER